MRPFVLVEYAHAMGNSVGNGIADYWRGHGSAIRRCRADSSGTWVDQALARAKTRPDAAYWAYGGDFGPAGFPTDGNFLVNGLVSADRKPHPHALRSRRRPTGRCAIRAADLAADLAAGRIEVENRRDFTDLSDLVGEAGNSKPGTEWLTHEGDRCPRSTTPAGETSQTVELVQPAARPSPEPG